MVFFCKKSQGKILSIVLSLNMALSPVAADAHEQHPEDVAAQATAGSAPAGIVGTAVAQKNAPDIQESHHHSALHVKLRALEETYGNFPEDAFHPLPNCDAMLYITVPFIFFSALTLPLIINREILSSFYGTRLAFK